MNQDLIGQTFYNGPDAITPWTVKDADDEGLVYSENKYGETACSLADFVRLAIADRKAAKAPVPAPSPERKE